MRALTCLPLMLCACGDPEVPFDVECASVFEAADDAELSSALASAGAGDCILLADGGYAGPIVLPAGVRLLAAANAGPTIAGGAPAVIQAGDGGGLYGITVSSGPARGILIDAADFVLQQDRVLDTGDAAVGIRCEDPGCLRGQITLDQVEIRRARSGLIVDHARVRVVGGMIADVTSTGLSGGGASYVANGGSLQIEGGELADSDYGVVADGADTRLSLRDATVRDCTAAGVWAQGLRGSAAAPGLSLEGSTDVSGHAGIGVLVLDSVGVSIAGTIEGTTLRTTVLPGGLNAELGDGLLLLDSSGDVSVAGATFRDNARAQAIVDAPGVNVVFGANEVDAANGAWQIVVQNGGTPVTVPAEDLSTAPLLPVPSDPLVLPSVGP